MEVGFRSFMVKHETCILKVKVDIEKVHLYHKALTASQLKIYLLECVYLH